MVKSENIGDPIDDDGNLFIQRVRETFDTDRGEARKQVVYLRQWSADHGYVTNVTAPFKTVEEAKAYRNAKYSGA